MLRFHNTLSNRPGSESAWFETRVLEADAQRLGLVAQSHDLAARTAHLILSYHHAIASFAGVGVDSVSVLADA